MPSSRRPRLTRPPQRTFGAQNPLVAAKAAPAKPAADKPAADKPEREKPLQVKPVKDKPAAERKPAALPLDGEGKPYITLAQLIKKLDLAPTGGAAKHVVRAGGITVNGEAEERPGRKLHQGDTVVVDGKSVTVELAG